MYRDCSKKFVLEISQVVYILGLVFCVMLCLHVLNIISHFAFLFCCVWRFYWSIGEDILRMKRVAAKFVPKLQITIQEHLIDVNNDTD